MKIKFSILFFIVPMVIFSQQNLLPTSSFYKDKIFSPFNSSSFSNGSFFPISESEFNLPAKIADSSKQYYIISSFLMKKHMVELKGEDFYITISPTLDVSLGKDLQDTITRKFQNTRGYVIEGDLFKNFSFSTSLYENQARFTKYESNYYLLIGELYPGGGGYSAQNAVIPSAGRTKYFHTDGFDYAYAIGNVVYAPTKKLQLSTGNNSHFVGSGYRSLLLSDNSVNAPYFQVNYKISDKWTFIYMRSRILNLMRRPYTSNVEAFYEQKALATNYITYKVSQKLNISLFEGTIWSRGNATTSTPVNPLFFNPIPILSSQLIDTSKLSTLLGINSEYLINSKNRVYSQIAVTNFDFNSTGLQLGYRGYNFGNLKNFMLQAEYNYVPKGLYASTNRRLNYSHYNLPLAHPKGNGFQEFIVRANYEYQRFYIDLKIIVYALDGYQRASLLPVDKFQSKQHGQIQHEQIEVGYRFNRKLNLTLFGSYIYRNDATEVTSITQFFNVGIRTGLINHYNDF